MLLLKLYGLLLLKQPNVAFLIHLNKKLEFVRNILKKEPHPEKK